MDGGIGGYLSEHETEENDTNIEKFIFGNIENIILVIIMVNIVSGKLKLIYMIHLF